METIEGEIDELLLDWSVEIYQSYAIFRLLVSRSVPVKHVVAHPS